MKGLKSFFLDLKLIKEKHQHIFAIFFQCNGNIKILTSYNFFYNQQNLINNLINKLHLPMHIKISTFKIID